MDTLTKATASTSSSATTTQTTNEVFVPDTIEQETYLLLLIADTLHEYVIDRAPEHHKVFTFLFKIFIQL